MGKLRHSHRRVSPRRREDLVLAKVAEAEDKTTGGILLPDSAQQKPTSGAAAWHVKAEDLLHMVCMQRI